MKDDIGNRLEDAVRCGDVAATLDVLHAAGDAVNYYHEPFIHAFEEAVRMDRADMVEALRSRGYQLSMEKQLEMAGLSEGSEPARMNVLCHLLQSEECVSYLRRHENRNFAVLVFSSLGSASNKTEAIEAVLARAREVLGAQEVEQVLQRACRFYAWRNAFESGHIEHLHWLNGFLGKERLAAMFVDAMRYSGDALHPAWRDRFNLVQQAMGNDAPLKAALTHPEVSTNSFAFLLQSASDREMLAETLGEVAGAVSDTILGTRREEKIRLLAENCAFTEQDWHDAMLRAIESGNAGALKELLLQCEKGGMLDAVLNRYAQDGETLLVKAARWEAPRKPPASIFHAMKAAELPSEPQPPDLAKIRADAQLTLQMVAMLWGSGARALPSKLGESPLDILHFRGLGKAHVAMAMQAAMETDFLLEREQAVAEARNASALSLIKALREQGCFAPEQIAAMLPTLLQQAGEQPENSLHASRLLRKGRSERDRLPG